MGRAPGELSACGVIKENRGYQSGNYCGLLGQESFHKQLFAHAETMPLGGSPYLWGNRSTHKMLLLTVPLPRLMFPRPVVPTAKAGTARNTLNTKSLSTRPARFVFSLLRGVLMSPKSLQLIPSTPRPLQLHRESVDMTASSPDTVGRRNLSSTKRQRLRKKWC